MSDPAIPMRRAREIRRARARTPPAKYPYIRRHLQPVELLSAEAIEIIEANAETILE
jgi:trimethylamine:corrinoid methyltransferase-like protein